MHAPTKAKKRSQSTLHNDNKPDDLQHLSRTAAELGLNVPLPPFLSKGRQAQKDDKVVAKKERNRRIKEAMSALASRADSVKQHQEFLRQEERQRKQDVRVRKVLMETQHLAARQARDDEAASRDAELRARQAEFVAAHLEILRQRDKAERRLLKKQMIQIEQLAAVAPKAVHIPVQRLPDIQAVRETLPVTAEEQPIVEAIDESKGNAVIVCGETGSGKTTQVPQFLWEAGYGHAEGAAAFRSGMIVVTEPRRVAAISMARRVAEELNEPFGDTVGYHVRYQNNTGPRCKLKFVTEGILLKEMQSDFMLRRYSAVVIDEAHERSVACDVLVGLLSRVVPLRQQLFEESNGREATPLKLVIMSATLRVADFRDNHRLFTKQPRLIEINTRRFPVSTHYSRRTELTRYVDEAFSKVRQLHKKLPPGGVLVFLATQHEIDTLCTNLTEYYRKTRVEYDDSKYTKHALLRTRQERAVHHAPLSHTAAVEEEEEEADEFGLVSRDYALDGDDDAPDDDDAPRDDFMSRTGLVDDYDYGTDRGIVGESDDEGAPTSASKPTPAWWPDDEGEDWGSEDASGSRAVSIVDDQETSDDMKQVSSEDEPDGMFDTLHILPLYSLMDQRLQQRVFEQPPPGKRLVVVATNIAETSITIPNIRYVIDAGRVKNKLLQPETEAQAFKIQWISQSAAEQRAGRAGRIGPGHCYRLYSTAVFANLMPKHADPEIMRTPLSSVVLMMKHLKIDHVGNFPFPSPPDQSQLKAALIHLRQLGALDANYRCTSLGSKMSRLPLTPRHARILLESIRRFADTAPQIVSAVLSICAVASTTMDVFSSRTAAAPAAALCHPGSDYITFLRAFNAFSAGPWHSADHCAALGLLHKSMVEAAQLRRQIEALVSDEDQQQLQRIDDGPLVADFDSNEAVVVPVVTPADMAAQQRCPPQPNAENVKAVETVPITDALQQSTSSDAVLLTPLHVTEELALRRLFIVGLLDHVARRATLAECKSAGFTYDDSKTTKTPYWDCQRRAVLFVHPSSSIAKTFPPPEWLIYTVLETVSRGATGAGSIAVSRLSMKGVTIVAKEWLIDAGFVEDAALSVDIDHAV